MSSGNMKDIRRWYGVPARRGWRVRYHGPGKAQMGTIKSARHGYLRILLDGNEHMGRFHPAWKLEYLDEAGGVILDTRQEKMPG